MIYLFPGFDILFLGLLSRRRRKNKPRRRPRLLTGCKVADIRPICGDW
ncbi:hypothetical protein LINPERPRIM_LOCUS25169 [Linum perenne]